MDKKKLLILPGDGVGPEAINEVKKGNWRNIENTLRGHEIIDKKIGIAVGVTSDLTEKYNAVELVKLGSKVIGGTGGGGRNDFAQAGGNLLSKIEESYQNIIEKI